MPSMNRCLVTGGELAYQSYGSGVPLVLVHGITTYSFIWRKLIPFLHQDFKVYVVDLLGCGHSAMPLDQSYSLKDHVSRVGELMDQLSLDRPHLIGHDLGGGICQIMAVQSPEKVRSLTLINSVGHNFWPVQPINAMRTPIVRNLLMAITDRRVFKLVVKRGLYHKELLTDELMDLFWKPLESELGRKAFFHFAKCLDNQDLTEIETDLQQLMLPVLILRGDADPYLSEEISEKLHTDISGSRLERIATASHFLMEDEPEWAARKIKEFLHEL
mgnify:CR=1 FL=1